MERKRKRGREGGGNEVVRIIIHYLPVTTFFAFVSYRDPP